jgi:hypothetical protein
MPVNYMPLHNLKAIHPEKVGASGGASDLHLAEQASVVGTLQTSTSEVPSLNLCSNTAYLD